MRRPGRTGEGEPVAGTAAPRALRHRDPCTPSSAAGRSWASASRSPAR